jgi:hypothetical protein
MEAKEMNTQFKAKYLDDFTSDLRAHNEQNQNLSRINIEDAQKKTRKMKEQTLAALQYSINRMTNIEEFDVEEVCGEKIKGPMKWLVLIIGANHKVVDINSLLRKEYSNLNIIVVLITNRNMNTLAFPKSNSNLNDKSALNGTQNLSKMGGKNGVMHEGGGSEANQNR